jgi:hypothetical protein
MMQFVDYVQPDKGAKKQQKQDDKRALVDTKDLRPTAFALHRLVPARALIGMPAHVMPMMDAMVVDAQLVQDVPDYGAMMSVPTQPVADAVMAMTRMSEMTTMMAVATA